MAKRNDFVGKKTALSTETLYGPYRSRTVDHSAMAAATHVRLHFLNMGVLIQSSLEISGLYANLSMLIGCWMVQDFTILRRSNTGFLFRSDTFLRGDLGGDFDEI